MYNAKFKTIFSLNIRLYLEEKGFNYVIEKDNIENPKMKCWVYVLTPELQECLDNFFEEREANRK